MSSDLLIDIKVFLERVDFMDRESQGDTFGRLGDRARGLLKRLEQENQSEAAWSKIAARYKNNGW